jgi:hypothetical protein
VAALRRRAAGRGGARAQRRGRGRARGRARGTTRGGAAARRRYRRAPATGSASRRRSGGSRGAPGRAAAYVRRAQDEAKRHSERAAKLEAELVELRSIPPLGPSPAPRGGARAGGGSAAERGRDRRPRGNPRELRLRISQLEPRAASADRLEDESAPPARSYRGARAEVAETRSSGGASPPSRRACSRWVSAAGPSARRPGPRPPPTGTGQHGGGAGRAHGIADRKVRDAGRRARAAGGGLGEPEAQEGLAAVPVWRGTWRRSGADPAPPGSDGRDLPLIVTPMVVSCRLFDCHGDHMALATLGTGEPPPSQLDRVVATVRRALALPAEEPGSPS